VKDKKLTHIQSKIIGVNSIAIPETTTLPLNLANIKRQGFRVSDESSSESNVRMEQRIICKMQMTSIRHTLIRDSLAATHSRDSFLQLVLIDFEIFEQLLPKPLICCECSQ
jgi:hypothetical protein